MTLRPYQEAAIRATYAWIAAKRGNPLIVLPTGAGKSHVIAQICADVASKGKRALILAHRSELLAQNAEKLQGRHNGTVGIYSASLGQANGSAEVVVAGIQSVYRRAAELGEFRAIVIDEAHLIPEDDDSMYRRLLAGLPGDQPLVIGLTATPFRLNDGPIYGPDRLFSGISAKVEIEPLIQQGFLSRLKSKSPEGQIDTTGVKTRMGDFEAKGLEQASMSAATGCVADMRIMATGRKSILVFCVSVAHAEQVCTALVEAGEVAKIVHGGTPQEERQALVADFRAGALRFLVNCEVLTTGFDAPNVDCVALMRPTKSPGLYYQMVGRGLRIAPGKADCLILDYGGNIERHGPITDLDEPGKRAKQKKRPKSCPACREVVAPTVRVCPECGYVWPEIHREAELEAKASEANILGKRPKKPLEWLSVCGVEYSAHSKLGKPDSMRVDYTCENGFDAVSEWVCMAHGGYAAEKAAAWWLERGKLPVPRTAAEALSRTTELRVPTAVGVEEVDGFTKIKRYDWPEEE